MLHSEEVEKRIERHSRFWREPYKGEGAYIAVTAFDDVNADRYKKVKKPASLEDRWFNVDYRMECLMYNLNTTYYAGDAVPTASMDFGPGVLAALLGAEFRLAEDTIWFDEKPFDGHIEELKSHIKFDTDIQIYKTAEKLTEAMCKFSEGRYVVSILDIGVNADVFSSLYSREKLLRSMVKEQESVDEILSIIDVFWKSIYEDNYALVKRYQPYMTSWIPLISSEKWYPLLSEFSSMVSPSVFKKLILPSLNRETEMLDKVLFNLDGEDEIKHLKEILGLNKLHAVQWDPVPKYMNKYDAVIKDFDSAASMNVYGDVQRAGKKLVINGLMPTQAVNILNNISEDGVFLFVNCKNRKEADDFIDYSRRWIK